MIPETLKSFLSQKGVWPQWLPPIVSQLSDDSKISKWDSSRDVPVICSNVYDDLEDEAKALISLAESKGFRVVRLISGLPDYQKNEEVATGFTKIREDAELFNSEIRRMILELCFAKEVFSDDSIRSHVDDYPQGANYPVLAKRLDEGKEGLLLIPEPSQHWRFSRINVMPDGEKV